MHFMVDGRRAERHEIEAIGASCAGRGIFSLDDMGHRSGIGLEAKGILDGVVSVRSAGYALYKKGTYGAFLGKEIAAREDIAGAVGEVAAAGADFLKVINSGIVCTDREGCVTGGGFSPEELGAVCRAARQQGLPVICHANSDEAVRNAVLAGVSSIEHGYFVTADTLRMMADNAVSWTPTVYALVCHARELPAPERRYLEGVIEDHCAAIREAYSLGVKLRVGTDSGSRGVAHGYSFFAEMRLFRDAGLSLERILAAACMDKDEMDKGNYLVVNEDFIESGMIAAVFKEGRRIFPVEGAGGG